MILDKIENIELYNGLHKRFAAASNYIAGNNLLQFENGKYEVDGDDVFVIVQEYETKPLQEGKMESHKKYIDIQLMLRGTEKIGYDLLTSQLPETPYIEEREVMFFSNTCSAYFKLAEGQFAIFYPWDIHMPGLISGEKMIIKKAVFKVKVA